MGQDEPDDAGRRERLARAVEEWCSQLIDVTGNNQLLYYRTLKVGTLELTDAAMAAVDTLLAGRTVRLSDLLPATDDAPGRAAEATKRATNIHQRALAHFEERGIETLFLAYGMATWTPERSKATPAAPVLVRPLKLDPRGAAAADFDVSLHGDWDVNATLLHLLATEYRTPLDTDEVLEAFDTSAAGAPDPTRLFERLVKEAGEVPDFRIDGRIVVGTFAYTKLPMVKDLQEHIDVLAGHDLIAAIAGDEGARAAVLAQRARDVDASLPDHTPPADEFLILDADASQNVAINAAVAGEPLIVMGPPGTGKSQTISNLIASLTARGQRVLFVAEKRAAIDAVTKRLRGVGLGDIVMDLHGGVTSKRQLAADLAHTLDETGRIPTVDVTELHHRLETSRSALTEHANALHEPRAPWGLSVAQVSEQLIGLGPDAETSLRFTGSRLGDLDADTARQARGHLVEWAALSRPLLDGTSPWAGATVTSDDDAQEALDVVDRLAGDTVPAARAELDDVLDETGLPTPASVDDWQATLALLTAVAATLATVSDGLFELDLDATADALGPGGRSWWSRLVAQLTDARYRSVKRDVRALWHDGKPSGRELYATVTAARDQAGEWASLGGQGTPRLPARLDDATGRYGELTDRLAALGAYLATRDLTGRSHRDLDGDVDALLADQQTLFRLPRVHALEQWLSSYHLGPLVEAVRRGEVDAGEVEAVFEHAWLSSIRRHVVARDPRLANFDGDLQHRRVEEFRDADVDHLDITAVRVRRAIAERAVALADAHPDQHQLVRKEANKKSRHITLRRLFEQAPDVLTGLRPCWVMSPLVVSQTLPAAPVFDVVIFDEASQVLPADAIPALLRAPQAVVAGDRHQLPPTTFFSGVSDGDGDGEEDDAALTAGFESILDVLDTLLGNRMLQWHYRSQDERLIAFSNHNIYDSGLITFPGAYGDGCISHELIAHRPGVSVDTRSNDDEVARVVELMVAHARTRPGETLGVIAMGQHHASRIDAALRARLAADRDPALDAFFDESADERAFVKNLERVQGDERDAIILSVGYGKQADGRLPYRFGPLLTDGGERRLNVAVTRARRRMTAVSSFSHVDMDPSRSSAKGVELLRRYLKYAESGGVDLDGAETATPLNPFEADVKYRLEQAGVPVIAQYGTSGFRIDFALPHPTAGRMALAVEADGASYHSSPTARDRDRLRQDVLERLGWRFHRIWSTDWFNDPQAETAKVVAAYEQAVADIDAGRAATGTDTGEAAEVSGDDEVAWEYDTPERDGRRPAVRPGGEIGDYRHADLVRLARWICSDTLLRTEAQLVEEMMAELGFRRRGSRIVEALTAAGREARDG